MTTAFQPPPTYAEPILQEEKTKRPIFNPIWLKWFVDIAQFVGASGSPGSGFATYTTLAGSSGSSLIGFMPLGAGAVAETVQAKLRNYSSSFDTNAGVYNQTMVGVGVAPVTYWQNVPPVDSTNQYANAFQYSDTATGTAANEKVCLWAGIQSGAASNNIWAANFVTQINAASLLVAANCLELDFNNNKSDVASNSSSDQRGLVVVSGGTFHPNTAIQTNAVNAGNAWRRGIDVDGFSDAGVSVGLAGAGGLFGLYIGKQLANGGDEIVLQRFTETSPTGNAIRLRDAANASDTFTVDVNGNTTIGGAATGLTFFRINPDASWSTTTAIIMKAPATNPRITFYRTAGDGVNAAPIALQNSNTSFQILMGANAAIGSETLAAKFTLDFNGNLTLTGNLTTLGGTFLTTTSALTNGAAAQTATLTNAPAAGNPTKWVPIVDNGVTRYIPAW